MDAIAALRLHGGVARVKTLRRLGVSEHTLRRERERGWVVSICRGWVALRDADAMLVAAARRGVVLSCVTLAERRGLWVTQSPDLHVAAPPHSGHASAARGIVHWNVPVFPRNPDSREDTLENALILIAGCQPRESALATWESALKKDLVDVGALRRAPLPPAARELLEEARPFADAGTETIFFTRLRWMNVRIVPQAWLLGHRVDFLIGERLVIQIDGGHHVGAQRTRDIRHDARLQLHGFHVIRIGYDQLINHWPEVQQMIMDAVGQRLHLAS